MVKFEFEQFEDFLTEIGGYEPLEVGIKANYASTPIPPSEEGMPPMARVVGFFIYTAAYASQERSALLQEVISSQVVPVGQAAKSLEVAMQKRKEERIALIKERLGDKAVIFEGAVSL